MNLSVQSPWLLPLFIAAFAVASLIIVQAAGFLSLAWHQKTPVFRSKAAWKAFLAEIQDAELPRWVVFGTKNLLPLFLESIAIEFLMLLFLLVHGLSLSFLWMMILSFGFLVALVSDLSWREIPHEINHIIAITAVLNVIFNGNSAVCLALGLIPAILLVVAGLFLYWLFPSKGFGIGGGDVRFIASVGMLAGFQFVSLLLAIGSLLTIIIHLPGLLHGFRKAGTTCVPMMAGFTGAFLLILGLHYLAPEDCLSMISIGTNLF